MIDKLNSKIFSEHLNSEFKISLPNAAPVVLRLTQVNERDAGPKLEQFSLFFCGPLEPRLQQSIYSLQHEKLGTLELFLVAVGIDQDGVQYESAFNRFRTPPGS
jgi:hypothetical protein